MTKRSIYWTCQVLGWSSYGFLQIFLYSTARKLDIQDVLGEVLQVGYYILTTHLLRWILIRNRWLNLSLISLVPRILLITMVMGFANYLFLIGYALLIGELTARDFLPLTIVVNVFGPIIVYFIWSMIYFTFHYFEQYNKSLKYDAVVREIELSNLRSQLNPHFIFNSLNSIRALVDENPVKSKEAITHLSNILRNSLSTDRDKLVPFNSELEMVKDYLALESVRYEERLQILFDIANGSNDFLIPPLMIQTLVENGIKHGVAKAKQGGFVQIQTSVQGDNLTIGIRNTGRFEGDPRGRNDGYGVRNTRKRLELLYGEMARFRIGNEKENVVLTEIVIPRLL